MSSDNNFSKRFAEKQAVLSGDDVLELCRHAALTASENTAKQIIENINNPEKYPYITASEAMKFTGCTRQSINKMERKGKVKGYWFGGKKLYKRSELIELIEGEK